jgi:hypothetical protein
MRKLLEQANELCDEFASHLGWLGFGPILLACSDACRREALVDPNTPMPLDGVSVENGTSTLNGNNWAGALA